jgi:DNA-directed RNA polymerase specialized sigma24 family protein
MDPTEPLLKNLKTFVAFARKRVGDPHLAEDVVQESLLKALKADRKPARNDDVIAWFYRILRRGITANNLTVRLHRARQRLRIELERTCRICSRHGCLDCSCEG